MKRIKKAKKLPEEAQYLHEKKLDYNLIKILSQDWEGTKKERERLNKIKSQLREEFYIEVIYVLTHKIINDVKKAKKIYQEIIDHKALLAKKLKRNVGIEVAALDYMKNVRSLLDKPEIIEKDKLLGLAAEAIIDDDTGIYERTALWANLNADIERAKRYSRPLSLLFCDIDNFKRVNDTLGHETGSKTLKIVAQSIREALRSTDMAFRYGGEEFVCILPETDLKSAEIVARHLRQKIANMKKPKEFKGHDLKLTISVGVAQYGDIYDAHSFVAAADKAMYQAKRKGKDQVCSYGPGHGRDIKSKSIKKRGKGAGVISGEVLSPGLAQGKAFIYRDILTRDILSYTVKEEDMDEEMKRIHAALSQVHKELQQTKEVVKKTVNQENADIFEAHKLMLKDERLLLDLEKELKRELVNAEQIVRGVFRRWANRFRISENELIQDKANDMDDLSRRVIRELLGYDRNVLEKLPGSSVIVAKRLLPSDTVHLNKKNVQGVVLEEGGYNSHSAILARSLGVPAICCKGGVMAHIQRKDILLIDGEKNKVIVNPEKKKKEAFEARVKEFKKKKRVIFKKREQKAQTKGGKRILVCANASHEDDFKEAVKNKSDGVGLFRIESLYLQHKTAPSREYLTKRMKRILKYASNQRIVIRLLDIGGDKQLPYIDIEEERNPFLGLRGVRLLLKHRKILRTQIQVVLDLLDQFNVELLVPMVSVPKEIRAVKKVLKEFEKGKGSGKKRKLKVGAMIETPASVVNIDEIAEISDFLSIGTNDLIQYTMAVGRENMSMIEYYQEGAETVVKLIRKVVNAAEKHSIPCCICGEMAGDEQYTERLLKTGITELSVTPSRIPFIKEKIRNIQL